MSETLIVTGPAGAGKSTVCQRFAETADGTWAYISQDGLRQMVKAGFKNPAEDWVDGTQTQWDVSHQISADMMKRYQLAGINCIADGFAPSPMASFENWPKYLLGINYKLVVIYPSIQVTLARNSERSGDARLTDTQIQNHHKWYGDFIIASGARVIDSTELSADGVVGELKRIVELADSEIQLR